MKDILIFSVVGVAVIMVVSLFFAYRYYNSESKVEPAAITSSPSSKQKSTETTDEEDKDDVSEVKHVSIQTMIDNSLMLKEKDVIVNKENPLSDGRYISFGAAIYFLYHGISRVDLVNFVSLRRLSGDANPAFEVIKKVYFLLTINQKSEKDKFKNCLKEINGLKDFFTTRSKNIEYENFDVIKSLGDEILKSFPGDYKGFLDEEVSNLKGDFKDVRNIDLVSYHIRKGILKYRK